MERVNSSSLAYIESMLEDFLSGQRPVPPEWAEVFKSYNGNLPTTWSAQPPVPRRSVFNPAPQSDPTLVPSGRDQRLDIAAIQERLDQLIRNYRVRGHIVAAIDPLGTERIMPVELEPALYGFTEKDMDREVSTSWVGGPETRTLRGILNWLKATYCRSIGAQFMHIDSLTVRQWLQQRMEETGNRIKLGREEQLRILRRLADAVIFEEFLAKKFVGAKSFSLEGSETLIPLLDLAIEKAANEGAREIVIGMAHRGRLNVLANVMGKSPRLIFREFDDQDPQLHVGRGDVKYHLGYSSDWTTSQGNRVHLSLCFNPSHLEYVNTVAIGRVRAKQDRFKDFGRKQGVCFLIHGDAAFAGEGIVQETLNLSELKGYRIGGTVHIVVNNQVGFTTSPSEGRSTTYATDVAKMLQIPIFHVNGEDPEAVAQVISLALDFRKKFRRDVVIDMYCYRRRGHNEGDEPEFTQPTMCRAIRQRPSVYEGYLQHLESQRGVTREEAGRVADERRQRLEGELHEARKESFIRCHDHWGGVWTSHFGGPASNADNPPTHVAESKLCEILLSLLDLPDDFTPHPKIVRLFESRREMAEGKRPLDWGACEMLAFGSILSDGRPLRMSGQDVRRGTFSHRHAVVYDYEDGHACNTLKNIAPEKGQVNLFNSPLSEAGVMGFEYGYSLDCPEGLVVWEAQFGDFSNAAQVIIDQFIASAEDKWARLSNLVLLLPHGFEGQGPEHSSARLERYLTLAAEDNIQIAQPSTPAQFFHLLRRQVMRMWKKPLIVMTPKSLLRHPACVSSLSDCSSGTFRPVIGDQSNLASGDVRKILLCSGKLYYELAERREATKSHDVAIVRIEEFYPVPRQGLEDALASYPTGTAAAWVQDEPENMGALRFLKVRFGDNLLGRFPFSYIGRPESSSPATGSHRSHLVEQETILSRAFE